MTRLSSMQYTMLKALIDAGSKFMNIEEAQMYDQRPFRSMLIQEWIAYTPGHGFHVTKLGKAAWNDMHSREIWRKDATKPLTAYFDPEAYGLHKPVRKSGAA